MKILLADDSQEKVEKVHRVLSAADGLRSGDVDTAFTVFDARRLLAENDYDLLILDILLPFRAGEPPRAENTASLLTELRDRKTLRKPRHIMGLTAYDEALRELAPVFQQQAWAIVRFAPESTAWSDQLLNSVKWLIEVEQRPGRATYGVDVCIITALDVPEFDAVLRTSWNWAAPAPVDDTTFARQGRFLSGGQEYSAVAAHCPRMGMVTAALLAAKMINATRPKYIAMAGICAAVKGKANYGDPVLADPCWDWQSGKHVVKDGEQEFEIAPDPIPIPERIRSRWEQLDKDRAFWAALKGEWPSAPETELKVRMGPSVSGSSVLADADIVENIKRQHRGLISLEMEAYGVLSAARTAPWPRATAFTCKSVCDFADDRKDDRWQSYAAFTSARAVQEFFERYMSELADIPG